MSWSIAVQRALDFSTLQEGFAGRISAGHCLLVSIFWRHDCPLHAHDGDEDRMMGDEIKPEMKSGSL